MSNHSQPQIKVTTGRADKIGSAKLGLGYSCLVWFRSMNPEAKPIHGVEKKPV